MLKGQAKKLKPGDAVVWCWRDSPRLTGRVERKHYNTVWIKWDDGKPVQRYFAETMDYVFTPEQLVVADAHAALKKRMAT